MFCFYAHIGCKVLRDATLCSGIGLAIIRNGLTSEYGLGITSLFFSVDAASKSTAVLVLLQFQFWRKEWVR